MRETRLSKGLWTLLACAAIALCCIIEPAFAESVEADDRVLTVGVPIDRCPVFYQDAETGEPKGIGVDLVRSAAEEAGYSTVIKPVTEATLKDALDSDSYDIIMPFGSAITSASGKPSVVSDNLMQTPFTLVTTNNNRPLPGLRNLHVGMLSSLGGGAETVRQLYPGIEITLYETMDDCVRALRADDVDALLHNSYVWSYVLQKPAYSDLVVQPSTMFSMDFRAGAPNTPRGRTIIGRLNGGIAALSDTQRQAIVLDHTSRRLYRYDLFDYLYQYGLILLLGLLLFAALVIITIQKRRSLRMEHEERVRRLVDHDSLTGALSSNGFKKRVEGLLRSNPDVPYLLEYANIKDFKYVNDSLGRAAGDELLRFWVSQTQATLSDKEAMGRLEGDHLGVLRLAKDDEQVRTDDMEVAEAVRNFFVDQGGEYRVHLCSGIYVLTPGDYEQINVDRMLDHARVAENRVRASHDDGYAFYNPEQWDKGRRTSEIVSHLPAAIQSGEIQVWYQPQVDYETKEVVGAEALCRWNHARLGLLSPAEFIPALEEHGIIYDLDRYVWERVCEDLQRWNRQGFHVSVSVNLSRCDIRENPDIPARFSDLIQSHGLTPDQLHVEITEGAYVENPDLIIRTTSELRNLGFRVEMDDFGSGYSSLNMLKEVPVDRIKLDLRFLSGAGDIERGRIIVSHIIQMVNSLGMDLIAEGVESEKQAHFLQDHGCVQMQGFYFFRPMQVCEFEKITGI